MATSMVYISLKYGKGSLRLSPMSTEQEISMKRKEVSKDGSPEA